MSEDEYRVYLIDLPHDVRGAVRLDEDGFASIYINSRLSEQTKKAAFIHEMRHIRRNDHHNLRKIREVERCPGRKSRY